MRDQITIQHNNFPNTGPVVNWLKLSNTGEKLLTLVSAINTPAVAAAFVIKSYKAKENDEISLQVSRSCFLKFQLGFQI